VSGRVYKACACRDANGKQLGQRCPELATDSGHGRWAFAVDLPSLDGRRKTMRRRGFAKKSDAKRALDDVVQRKAGGVRVDDRETLAAYLTSWLHGAAVHAPGEDAPPVLEVHRGRHRPGARRVPP
jgi:hypothetical protein